MFAKVQPNFIEELCRDIRDVEYIVWFPDFFVIRIIAEKEYPATLKVWNLRQP